MSLEVLTVNPGTGITRHKHTLLFVHGGWHGAWCWANFQEYFADRGYRSHAISLRGHSNSDGPLARCLEDYIADVLSVAEQLDHPILIGHSMGGLIVQKYLSLQYPCDAAILLAPLHPKSFMRMLSLFILRYPMIVFQLMTGKGQKVFSNPRRVKNSFFSADMSIETVNEYSKMLCEESSEVLFAMFYYNVDMNNINTPTLLIAGKNDLMVHPFVVKSNAKLYPSKVLITPTAHDIMLDVNWEYAARGAYEWITRL